MGDKEKLHILIELVHVALVGKKLDPSTVQLLNGEVLTTIHRMAKKHDLSHVISDVIYQNNISVDDGFRRCLQQRHYASVCRCEQMKYAQSQIYTAFEQAGIDYIPLKGALLRAYYPKESMRTSCDIDILIRETDLDSAIAVLEESGFSCGSRNYHDVSLFASNGSHLELHFNIRENRKNLDAVLENAWDHAVKTDTNHQYAFTDEFFVFYMFAHMAYHFMRGGCGIRSLMDLWVMEHKMGLAYDKAESLLKQAGIYPFAWEMSRIANQCFTENRPDAFADRVLDYVVSGGAYGSARNHMVVKKVKANNTFFYALHRLFLPPDGMKTLYPILKKAPILLPFCWTLRWFTMLFGGKLGRAVTELARTNTISEQQMQEIRDIFTRMEL